MIRSFHVNLLRVLAGAIVLGIAPGVAAQTTPAASSKAAPKTPSAQPSPGAGPIVVVDTVKGTFEFETYPEEAPKSVEHVLGLVRRNFYNGQRVHRVEPNFVVQWGDSRSRDMTKRDVWGQSSGGGSGKPVGVAEITKMRSHVRGAVGMAHAGDPKGGDSQLYVTLKDHPELDGRYTVIGKVISGMDVVDKLQVTDIIRKMSIKSVLVPK